MATRHPSYRPLDPAIQEIRILDVAPGHGADPVRCSIRHVALTSDPKPVYETISYVWGDPNQRGRIILDDSELDVPASSEVALRRMRYVDRHRALWIDAVCIDQNDTQEKNQQVTMMGNVYALGQMTLVWLGFFDGVEDLADNVATILSDFRHCTDDFARFHDRASFKVRTQVDLSPLRTLITSAWFERLWVVQEVALAPQSMCHYNDRTIPLVDLLRVYYWLSYTRSYYHTTTGALPSIELAIGLWTYVDHEHGLYRPESGWRDKSGGKWSPLRTLLVISMYRQTCNSKDHVFAIMGLYRSLGGNQPLRIDYTKSVAQVYADATRTIISEESGLEYLEWLSGLDCRTSKEMPSWSLDYSRCFDETIDASLMPSAYHADLGLPVKLAKPVDSVNNNQVLSVEGFVCAIVVGTSPTQPDPVDFIDLVDAFVAHRRRHKLATPLSDSDVAQTLVLGRLTTRQVGVAPRTLGPEEALRYLRELWHYRTLPADAQEVEYQRLLENRKHNPGSTDYGHYMMAINSMCRCRRSFVTSAGGIGIGPATMREGDTIAILYGSQWPLVLRKVDSEGQQMRFEILGLCYLHGVMEGEAMREHQATGREDVTFHLH